MNSKNIIESILGAQYTNLFTRCTIILAPLNNFAKSGIPAKQDLTGVVYCFILAENRLFGDLFLFIFLQNFCRQGCYPIKQLKNNGGPK